MSDIFPIFYDQPELWSDEDRATVELAAHIIGTRISKFTGLDAAASFEQVFGEQHARFNNGIDFYEYSTGNVMIFRRGRVYLELVIHAIGHTFDRQADMLPQKQLSTGRFNLRHGLLFQGMHPPSMDGGNDPNERWANTWENYIWQTFAPNIFGDALDKFMDEHMAEWTGVAMWRTE